MSEKASEEVNANVQARTPEAQAMAELLAKRVKATSSRGEVNEAQLSDRIGEIEEETQAKGPNYLKVKIIDPEWELQNSGFVDVDSEGLLDPIEVEFPEGSGRFWVFCAVEGSTNVSEAGFIMTFQDKIFAKLASEWGVKVVPAGTQTRAAFVNDLLVEAGVSAVIPGINILQPVEEEKKGELGQAVIESTLKKENTEADANKTPGVTGGSAIKVDGATPDAQQLADINTALSVARRHSAPPAAVEALIVAGITESGFKREASENNEPSNPHKGIWQSDIIPGDEVAKQAEHFLIGGESFAEGGAIARANKGIKPAKIAVEVEVGGDEKRNEEALPEAQAIIKIGGGGTGGTEAKGDVGQLKRGTDGNPDENSAECIERLAEQVDWNAFSDGFRFYYMTGPELAHQRPALYIDIPGNHVVTKEGVDEYGVILAPTTYTFDNCLALDTPIPMPSGWTTMGKLQVDDMVLGSDGQPTRVLRALSVQHDRDCYRVCFDDDTSIVADAGHRWETRTVDEGVGIRETLEIHETLHASTGLFNHRIRGVKQLDQPDCVIVAVDPVESVPVRCIEVDAEDHLFLAGEGMKVNCNTSFEYRKTHKIKQRTQKRAKTVKPSSPSEVKLDLICDIGQYVAGQAMVFRHSGPVSSVGTWLIVQTLRKCMKDVFTEILLEPPIEPLPEPKESSKEEVSAGEGGQGTTGGATEQAERALSERDKYQYSEGSNRGNNGTLYGQSPRTMDCSSFVTLTYKAAGLPDPSNLNYEPIGDTSTLIANCEKVSDPTKDDLVFFGPSEKETVHVTLYVGGGKAIAMQSPENGLGEGPAKTFGPAGFLGYFRPKNY